MKATPASHHSSFNLESFFEKFDLFADAPDAVAKMRELILELAVRGQLSVRRDADQHDPSWHAFLSSLETDPVVSAAAPFAIPSPWRWTPLSSAADCRVSAKVGATGISESDWILDLEDIEGARGTVVTRATFAERRSLSTKARFNIGDVLYGKLRPYLNKVVVADSPGFCTTEIVPIRPRDFANAGYLRLVLRSPCFLRYAAEKNYGMKMPRLGTKDLEAAPVPLPPLAEQKRIVAKVDELMALCDRLEAQQQEREQKHAALARASLARFADAPTPDNLNVLFHKSYDIAPADLRKTILTLAVQGKLVPQDPNDEPAAALLQSTAVERVKLVTNKRIKSRPRAAVDLDEQPFHLPSSWAWARLSDVGHELGQKVPDKRFTYIDVGGIDSDKGRISDRIEELEPGDAPSRARKLVARGTVIYSTVRPYLLNIAIVNRNFDPEPIASTAFGVLHPFAGIDSRYLFYWLRSVPFTEYVEAEMKGMAYPAINDEKFYSGYIAVPPLAEQKRIVAKVNELMALEDDLDAQLAASRVAGEKLLAALVAQLTTGKESHAVAGSSRNRQYLANKGAEHSLKSTR